MDTLAQLIRRRIADAYDTQAQFARAIGVKPSTLNTWLKGRVSLPEPDTRRRLARELGIRHVDILVMAGELWPGEIEPMPELPLSDIEKVLAEVDPKTRAGLVHAVRTFVEGAYREVKEVKSATDQPVSAQLVEPERGP